MDLRSEPRGNRWPLIALVVALVWLLASVTPSPFAIEKPGPVINALGSVTIEDDEVAVITIGDAATYETSGELNILSVAIIGTPDASATWIEVAGALFDPARSIVPLAELYPSGVTSDDRIAVGAAMMRSSQVQAVAAALGEAGVPVQSQLRVVEVDETGSADGVLQVDDVLRTVNREPVATMTQLRAVLAAADAGAPIALEVDREGAPSMLTLTPKSAEAGAEPILGISVVLEYEFPFAVNLSLGDVGGPSAGVMLALAVYDELTPGGLTGGLIISGTGAINGEGRIGPIGGLEQKLWGAARVDTDLFLLPSENCQDLPARIPGDVPIVAVQTLGEAIAAITSVAAGDEVSGVIGCSPGNFDSGHQ